MQTLSGPRWARPASSGRAQAVPMFARGGEKAQTSQNPAGRMPPGRTRGPLGPPHGPNHAWGECRARGWRGRAVCRGCWGLPDAACMGHHRQSPSIDYFLASASHHRGPDHASLLLMHACGHCPPPGRRRRGSPWPLWAPDPKTTKWGLPTTASTNGWHTVILGALWCPHFGKQPHTPDGPTGGPGRYRWGK